MVIENKPLFRGTILQRRKRFLCDVLLDTGQQITAHCPNSGSMKGIPTQNSPVMLSYNDSPSRVYKYTLEMVYNGLIWIGVNTLITNKIALHGITSGIITELTPYQNIRQEVKISDASRIDMVITQDNNLCYVEVKNVSLTEGETAMFPDAVTTRGQKHLDELMKLKQQGFRAVMLFIIQRDDCSNFRPANKIDPQYAAKLKSAIDNGVEAYAYKTRVLPETISIIGKVPVNI